MKEFFKKTGITVGIVLLLILAALLAASFSAGASTPCGTCSLRRTGW